MRFMFVALLVREPPDDTGARRRAALRESPDAESGAPGIIRRSAALSGPACCATRKPAGADRMYEPEPRWRLRDALFFLPERAGRIA
jgi:hypothetical protein